MESDDNVRRVAMGKEMDGWPDLRVQSPEVGSFRVPRRRENVGRRATAVDWAGDWLTVHFVTPTLLGQATAKSERG